MGRRGRSELSGELVGLEQRLSRWREGGQRGRRIPEYLWSQAVGLAREHGVYGVARALRLDYYSLKRRIAAVAPTEAKGRGFVEVAIGAALAATGCSVKIGRADGIRMIIRTASTSDVVAVVQAFLGAGR